VPHEGIYYDQNAWPNIDAVTANIHEERELGLVKDTSMPRNTPISACSTRRSPG
jgi:hypothetical protein